MCVITDVSFMGESPGGAADTLASTFKHPSIQIPQHSNTPALQPEGMTVDRQARTVAGPELALVDLGVTGLFVEDEEESWQDRALCAQTDPEAFFPEKGGSTREAKKICTGCEVKAECLEYALANDERFGIWGGLSERERRRIKREAVM